MVQHPGEVVVTWPAALQCSFHHGWTLSESVMFATADWLPFGIQAMYAPPVVSLKHCKRLTLLLLHQPFSMTYLQLSEWGW